jgi:GTP-binding protein
MTSWIVAIVGRPNVGKSTLFNRMVGARTAIVDDQPGVTRDRHYGITDWNNKRCTVIDTGGYVPASTDIFEAAIREQAEIAITEADMVLFVVDAVEGIHAMDREIADILRRSQKKVLLLVNKSDNELREASAGEFYALGFGAPHPISALGGRRIGDLLDAIVHDAPENPSEPTDPRLKLAVIGKPNVGKSSFVNALLQENRNIVTDIPGTTRDSIDSIVRFYGEEILLVDTAGLRRKSKITESIEFYSTLRTFRAIDRSDVAIILVDAQQGLEHQDLRVIETAMERRRSAVLVMNKWDLVEKDELTARAMERALRERLRVYDFLPIIFISAKTNQRVHKVLEMAKTVNEEQQRKIPTSTLNDLLGQDILRFPPRARSGKELKIKYITQVGSKPPVFAFFANDPIAIEDGYKRYLENKLREHFTFTGVPLVMTFKHK